MSCAIGPEIVRFDGMSATEILDELPRLSRQERSVIARRIFEIDENRADLDWATLAADLGFQELDKMEQGDGSSATR